MFISDSFSVNEKGHLAVGGADVCSLAEKYGTPLYLMDEDGIRENCRKYKAALSEFYGGNFRILYASKAFSAMYIYRIMNEEGLGVDVVSGGELFTAVNAGFPTDKIYFHGNNKTEQEISYALEVNIGGFVVDNREELHMIDSLAQKMGKNPDIMFRIKPGVDAHTHDFVKTGQIDSKFGVALENGEAFEIVREAIGLSNVNLVGVHCHIGSQIFDAEPFSHAAELMLEFMAKVKKELSYEIKKLNLGGGFGIKYVEGDDPRDIRDCVKDFTDIVKSKAKELNLSLPFLFIEPGRSMVAPMGMTVYTVGSVKEIKDIRTYVSVDGGMTDNPRYALYGAEYTMLLPERPLAEKDTTVTVAGRNCESGDLLGENIKLPQTKAGALLAVLATGAYNYSMSSNYNRVPRPPVVMVSGGKDKLIVRRETYDDIMCNDLL